MTTTSLFLYTDGSCSPNPGKGGWAAILVAFKDGTVVRQVEMGGSEPDTTNNRMELRAVIEGLKALSREGVSIVVATDSQYVIGAAGTNKAKVNADLVGELRAIMSRHSVTIEKVAAHSGQRFNEMADSLAKSYAAATP